MSLIICMSIENKKYCDICDKYYTSSSSFSNHKKLYHKECNDSNILSKKITEYKYKCRYCNNTYKHKQSKYNHKKNVISTL